MSRSHFLAILMRMRMALAALVLCACSKATPDPGRSDAATLTDAGTDLASTDLGPPDMPALDTDGDGLLDVEEGYADGAGPDTDGDGLPDGEVLDSDADGLADAIEALPRAADGAPSDANGDGLADFRDPDCDANGRPDGDDAFLVGDVPGDLDGDGVADFRDPDDDGDGMPDTLELGESAAFPTDFDSDGTPDFRDRDSDGDTILDGHEYNAVAPDWDGDGLRNPHDLDSDADGYPDAEEAGDDDLETFPVDTDNDGEPDFLDGDSDDDGLFDDEERELGLDRRARDTDGDGEDDLLEALAGSDGNDAAQTSTTLGVLLSVTSFRQPAVPEAFPAGVQFEVPAGAAPAMVSVSLRDVSGGAAFVERIEVDRSSPGCADSSVTDTNGDGFDDAFVAPAAGSRLCWTLTVRPNRTVPSFGVEHPMAACRGLRGPRGPQLFEAALDVAVDAAGTMNGRFLAMVPPDSVLIGPDAPWCRSCELPEACLSAGLCPCL